MATTTTNLGLTKPAYADDADIAVINGNMDILDTKIGAVGNTDIQSQITTLDGKTNQLGNATSLGEVATLSALQTALDTKLENMVQGESKLLWFQTGSSAVETIGSYVRCEGYLMCVYASGSRKDLSVVFIGNDGTQVQLSRLNGVWKYNDLNNKIATTVQNFQYTQGSRSLPITAKRSANVVEVRFFCDMNIPDLTTICTLPEIYRPSIPNYIQNISVNPVNTSGSVKYYMSIDNNGAVVMHNPDGVAMWGQFHAVYVV